MPSVGHEGYLAPLPKYEEFLAVVPGPVPQFPTPEPQMPTLVLIDSGQKHHEVH
jgi:hypothetical protein